MQTVAHEGSNSIWINPLHRCFIIAGGSFVSCGLLPSRLTPRRSLSVIFGYCLGTSPQPLSFVRPGDFCREVGSCKPHLKIQPQTPTPKTPTAKTPTPNRLPPIHPRPRGTGTLGAPTSSSAHGSPPPDRLHCVLPDGPTRSLISASEDKRAASQFLQVRILVSPAGGGGREAAGGGQAWAVNACPRPQKMRT